MADNMYNPWEEKLYETLAKQVLVIVNQHREEATKIGQAVQELNTNPRYSDFGKNELVQKLREELKALNESKTNELKALVQQFVNEYQVVRADDGKADSQDIANALKVIEMCGNHITVEVLFKVYVQYKSVKEAAFEMNMSYPYVRGLHRQALAEFEETYADVLQKADEERNGVRCQI